MAQLFTIGRVTADLEQKMSARGHPYIQFSLAERIGYGEAAHTQYYQVWAWEWLAQQLISRGVKRGSVIWVSGSLELEQYAKKDGVTRDKRLKLKLTGWDFVPAGQPAQGSTKQRGIPQTEDPGPAGVIDGERETLPE